MKKWLFTLIGALGLSGFAQAADLAAGDCQAPKPQTDLSRCDYNGANLSGRDLKGARFGGKINNANFENADLAGRVSGSSTFEVEFVFLLTAVFSS